VGAVPRARRPMPYVGEDTGRDARGRFAMEEMTETRLSSCEPRRALTVTIDATELAWKERTSE